MKLKSLILAVLAGGALLASCQQEKPIYGISTDKDVLEFTAEGGQAAVQVTTGQAWTVSIPADAQEWLVANPTSGTGSASVVFTAAPNNGKDRKAGVKIKAGMSGYVNVAVNQAGSVAAGDGLTPETAWSASEANAWVKANLTDKQVTTEKYYIKGKIHKVQTTFAASGTFGNAVFFMSDNGQAASDDFEAYQVYYLEGKQWVKGQPDVEVGDDVIIYGPVTLYGSTAETSGKGAAFIYSHLRNGETPTPPEEEDYTKAEAKTVAQFIAAADANTYYKLTGTVSSFNATYCSFDLTDATGKIYVYSVLADYKTEWASKIKNGGTITIAAKYKKYNDKDEAVDAAILSFEAGQGGGDDDYTKAEAKTVAEFIAAADANTYYKLTGTVSSFNATYCSFDLTDATGKIYVYSVLADYKTEWASKIKNGGTITIAGKYKLYNEKHEVVEAAILSFEGGGDEPGGGETDYSKAEAKTVAEFIAAADADTYYKLTGAVSSFNATYCSFDLEDATGKIYVYSVLSDYKTEWKSKIKNGGTITIAGKYKLYNEKHEVVDAAILSFEGGDEPGGGGDASDFTSNVSWELGDAGYTQDATVNGVSGVSVLKLGTSKKGGQATLSIPSGSTKMTFYGISWNNADVASLVFKKDGTEIQTVTLKANSGLAGNPTYTITVTDDDKYEITIPAGATTISVETSGGYRAALFGLKAE